jgi:hypothetical protein
MTCVNVILFRMFANYVISDGLFIVMIEEKHIVVLWIMFVRKY